MKIIKIKTPFIKLDQFLKFAEVVQGGGEAKILIQDGLVEVNGEVCIQRGKKLYSGDRVQFENESYEVQ
ncbi:S4 domain-containing protein YaaA [Gottschalkiaceae bacterium SANA]|nr:S4 domain-containing protein YaaA [Gottschalkiaceae bacterium SANA]